MDRVACGRGGFAEQRVVLLAESVHGGWVCGRRCFGGSGGTLERVPLESRAEPDDRRRSQRCGGPSANWCMAAGGVGKLLAARWNGRAWADRRLPAPAVLAFEQVAGLSCTSAKACTVVGTFTQGGDSSNGFAERWNGIRWRVQSVGGVARAGGLSGISCPSARACTAVGSTSGSLTLAQHWAGSRWSVQDTPNGSHPATGQLNAVSCNSPTACTAVGSYLSTAGELPLVERWDGSSWAIQASAKVSPGATRLVGVSCASLTMCIAVGWDAFSPARAVVEAWDGTSWTIQPTPTPSGGADGTFLTGVSCTSPEACTAVGSTGRTGNTPLVERWDGNAWTIQSAPEPANSGAHLNAVSCTSPTDCTAVGGFTNGGPPPFIDRPLVESWDGSSWTIDPAPSPVGGGELAGVSCTSTSACTAVGYEGSTATGTTLAETWDGSAWTIDSTVTPNTGTNRLLGVSCTSGTACISVGGLAPTPTPPLTFGTQPGAEAWNGSSWTLQSTPGAVGVAAFNGISCPSPALCIAVGTTGDTPLAELYS